MNGGFQMKEFYKKRFALTDKGARNLSKGGLNQWKEILEKLEQVQ